jgi:integrase
MQDKLTLGQIRDVIAKTPHAKKTKYPDGGGLNLVAMPSGGLFWKLKYRVAGVEKELSIGAWPAVSLVAARDARAQAKAQIAARNDPSADKAAAARAAKAPQADGPTFAKFADDVLAARKSQQQPETKRKWETQLGHAKAAFGPRDIGTITNAEVLAFLSPWQTAGNLTALHGIRARMAVVFRRAIWHGACASNPCDGLTDMLLTKRNKKFKAIVDPTPFADMLQRIDAHGRPVSRAALLFLALTFQRPNMVRLMEWAEIDWQAKRWIVPDAKMKGWAGTGRQHIVPLSAPAIDLLRGLLPLTGAGKLVFPGRHHGRPMGDGGLAKVLARTIGSPDHVAHGFRAAANTLIKEQLAGKLLARMPATALLKLQEIIDVQLAHILGGTRGAYDRALLIDERTVLMEVWGEYVDGLRGQAPRVVKLGQAA